MSARAAAAPPEIDITVASDRWSAMPEAEATVRDAIGAVAADAPQACMNCEVSVVLTDDAAIRALNRDWRGRDAATNVLSFPAPESPAIGLPAALGDVVLAYETIAREAERDGKPFRHHLAHLVVHGMLHLLGHDHEADDDAERMEEAERRILRRLGVDDPYAFPDDGA